MKEYRNLTLEQIRFEVLPAEQPAILRDLVGEWRAVREFLESPSSLVRYLQRIDNGAPVDALMTAPEIEGQIGYNAAMSGFNFHRNRLPLSEVAAQLLRYAQFSKPPAVAAQSALIRDCLPAFADDNVFTLLDPAVLPRIWLGNRISTPIHVDEWNNLACVVAGRRRFTLFPPQQIANLYIGPLDFAPTGAAMSMVSLREPDFVRFPRLRAALAAAQVAELSPGDAVFMPPLWWHHVESLEPFNMLVNYWWHGPRGASEQADSAFDAMLHAILSIRGLPLETRRAWSSFFAHYIFGAADQAVEEIPRERHGILGELSEQQIGALRSHLAGKLTRS